MTHTEKHEPNTDEIDDYISDRYGYSYQDLEKLENKIEREDFKALETDELWKGIISINEPKDKSNLKFVGLQLNGRPDFADWLHK